MENAARLDRILSLYCARNSSVIFTGIISINTCSIFNFCDNNVLYSISIYMCMHVQDFVPVGVRFDSGLLKGPCMKWIYFDCLNLQEPSQEKGKALLHLCRHHMLPILPFWKAQWCAPCLNEMQQHTETHVLCRLSLYVKLS